MNKITKALEGKKVWLLPTGNNARGGAKPIQVTVIKVAKVFITFCKENSRWECKCRFTQRDHSLSESPNSGYILFEAIEDLDIFVEERKLRDEVSKRARDWGAFNKLSLDDLKTVARLLGINYEKN